MAFTNFDTKEINCKIFYFGPPYCGKTTNLRAIYKKTSLEFQSGLMRFEETTYPTRFFDFLPLSLGQIRDYHVKLHLYTLPTNSLYKHVNSVLLKGIDGFVFVVDSAFDALNENIKYLNYVKNILIDEGVNFLELPKVFQYNKRDLHDAIPVPILRQTLNTYGVNDNEAIASQGIGSMETLQQIAKLILKKLSE